MKKANEQNTREAIADMAREMRREQQQAGRSDPGQEKQEKYVRDCVIRDQTRKERK